MEPTGVSSYGTMPYSSELRNPPPEGLVDKIKKIGVKALDLLLPCTRAPKVSYNRIEMSEGDCLGISRLLEEVKITNDLRPILPQVQDMDWVSFYHLISRDDEQEKVRKQGLVKIVDREFRITFYQQQSNVGRFFDGEVTQEELCAEAKKWISLPFESLKKESAIEEFLYDKNEDSVITSEEKSFVFKVYFISEGSIIAECKVRFQVKRVCMIQPEISVTLFDEFVFYDTVSPKAFSRLSSGIHDLQFGRLR